MFADNIADGAAGGERVRAVSINGLLKRGWIPLLLVVVLSVSALVVSRLHKMFASQDLNAERRRRYRDRPVQPEGRDLRRLRPARAAPRKINYWDADANTHQVNNAPLPWSITLSTTLPAVSANIMAQTDGDHIGCRITVDGDRPRGADSQTASTPRRSAW